MKPKTDMYRIGNELVALLLSPQTYTNEEIVEQIARIYGHNGVLDLLATLRNLNEQAENDDFRDTEEGSYP